MTPDRSFWRALALAVPISLALWALMFWLARLAGQGWAP